MLGMGGHMLGSATGPAAAAAPSGGPTLWTMPLDHDFEDLTSSAPPGVIVRDPSAKLGAASISAGALSVLVGASAARMDASPYAAPGVGVRVTRPTLYEGVRVRARVKLGALGSGSFPSVGLAIIKDVGTATADRTSLEFRCPSGGIVYLWNASFYAGPSPSQAQKTQGVWFEANVGATGGTYWRYGYTDTDDPDAVTWVGLSPDSSFWDRTGWSVSPTKLLPGSAFRAVVYSGDDGAGGTGRMDCTYFDVLGGAVDGAA